MKRNGAKESGQLKPLSLKIQDAASKNVVITKEKRKQYIRKIMYINQVHLPAEFTPVIDFTDELVIQCDFPVVKNTFVDH